MDATYQNAIQKRLRLRKELEKLDLFIAVYDELAEEALENARQGEKVQNVNIGDAFEVAAPSRETPTGFDGAESARRVTDNPKPAEVIAAVKSVLRERGQPLTRSQIREALDRRGVVIRGGNPTKVLGTTLWRSPEIETIEGLGYWVKGERWRGDGKGAE